MQIWSWQADSEMLGVPWLMSRLLGREPQDQEALCVCILDVCSQICQISINFLHATTVPGLCSVTSTTASNAVQQTSRLRAPTRNSTPRRTMVWRAHLGQGFVSVGLNGSAELQGAARDSLWYTGKRTGVYPLHQPLP